MNYLLGCRFRFSASAILMVLSSILIARADEPISTATYSLEDFEDAVSGTGFPLYFAWFGPTRGTVDVETHEVHGGKQAARLSWQNSKDVKPEIHPTFENGYVLFYEGRHAKLLGDPVSISIWVHANSSMVGTPFHMLLKTSGPNPLYFTSKVSTIAKPGWSQYIFNIADFRPAPGTPAGPMTQLPLVVEGILTAGTPTSSGSLVLDDITVTTKGNARELAEAKVVWENNSVINWGRTPSFQITLANHADSPLLGISAHAEITDFLTGKKVWEQKWNIGTLTGKQTRSEAFTPEIPEGVYNLNYSFSDGTGLLPGDAGSPAPQRLARMAVDGFGPGIGKAEKAYMKNWGLVGGNICIQTRPFAKSAGITWERTGNDSCWAVVEKEPGKLDASPVTKLVKQDYDLGIDVIYLNTVYNQPVFRALDQESFAPAYGSLLAADTVAGGDMVRMWELGNEDNGTGKFVWSEIARHGAAGVRSKSGTVLTGTTGTASVDINFMRLQAERGVLDRIDALVTHPYTWASSPEAYGLDNQFGQIDQLIDELGGMKFQLTTEFGYIETLDQLKRAQYIARNYGMAAAAGLFRHGVYNLSNDFGIYNNTDPYPAAGTFNAYEAMTYGYRFAGWFQKDAVWAAAYDKAGTPMVMAWTPVGVGTLKIPLLHGEAPVIRDMFGALLPNPSASVDGKTLDIPIAESPIYVSNIDHQALQTAYQNDKVRSYVRFRKCLEASSLKDAAPWKDLGETATPEDLKKALMSWKPKDMISKPEQAIIAQTVRWLDIANHAQAARGNGKDEKTYSDMRSRWVERMKSAATDDIDLMALRWLLHVWSQDHDESAMDSELGSGSYGNQVAALEPVYDYLAGQLADHGAQIFFPVWPYIHMPSKDGKLTERFTFVPGKAVPVKVRVKSYSQHSYEGEVSLEGPSGWQITPPTWKGKIGAMSSQELDFAVTAGNNAGVKSLIAVLMVPGKPVVKIPFDDFTVLPPLEVHVPVLSTLLPAAPLPLQLINNGTVPIGAAIRVVEKPNTPAFARAKAENIGAGEIRKIDLPLGNGAAMPAYNEWSLIAEMSTADGKNFNVPLPVDFDLAVRAKSPPTIDGDLSDWKDAAPLHIDQEKYAQGSYTSGWSKEDESGIIYTKWDDQNFYVAAHVHDQTFQQALTGGDVWAQDSVQVCLVGANNQRQQFSLAQTPKGPEIWSNTANTLVPNAQLKVVLKPGEAFCEAAIPWAAIGITPGVGSSFRFDVALNDDDAIVKRRFMERYGVGIVAATSNDALGYLHLGDASPEPNSSAKDDVAAKSDVLFYENFEEYPSGTIPDSWHVIGGPNPKMQSWVQEGKGIDGSKALEIIHNDPQQPNVYITMTRPLSGLVVGKKYRLSFKVKGLCQGAINGGAMLIAGTCLDDTGNIGYNWPVAWTPSDQWQEVDMDWTSVGGDLNVVIRNTSAQTDSLVIDDIKVAEIP